MEIQLTLVLTMMKTQINPDCRSWCPEKKKDGKAVVSASGEAGFFWVGSDAKTASLSQVLSAAGAMLWCIATPCLFMAAWFKKRLQLAGLGFSKP